MNKSNLYLYILILFIVVIFLALVVFVLQARKNAPAVQEPTNTNLPTPTTIEVRTTIPPTPTEIPPTSTGVFEEQLPKAEQDLVDQKQALKSKTPLTNPAFTITFDYAEDKFVVELALPKADSQTKFSQWISTNYPAIPLDRFILK
jgi:heme/copper-type cytochrome/quinol oxidase subunit 2